jgi:hypothetical protein
MSSHNAIDYFPAPTIKAFIRDYTPHKLFFDWIVGPVGSGKTTALFMKLVYLAGLQMPGLDGIRRTRAVIVRNTNPQLSDTTLVSWFYWFKPGQAGDWSVTNKRFLLKFADIECEVLFRPLDTVEDISRVLSLEVTFAIIDEFVQIPKSIVDALSARCGRYPAKKDGGATNWGLWGSSNPSTEDNWWFEHLHNQEIVRDASLIDTLSIERNETYFKQPSALSPEVENLENLPGGTEYYTSVCKGKSDEWIKQFVECEWGFSVSGKAVIASFNKHLDHISKTRLRYSPHLPLVAGLDPGLAGSALVFGQQDLHSRLLVLGELVQENMGSERIIEERLKPYLRRWFPEARLIIAPDPAGANRQAGDETEIIRAFRRKFEISIESNNRLPLRVDALNSFCTRVTDVGPALLVDEEMCPNVIRALKGGWRFAMDPKKDQLKGPDPEKNQWSHVGDATGYCARYFHRQTERELRYGGVGVSRFTPPRFKNNYHFA